MTNQVTGKIVAVERKGTSYYGNPYYAVELELADGSREQFRTRVNSMFNYAVTNSEFREADHTFNLSDAGRIVSVVR